VFCQFEFLRRCIRTKDIERTLDELPKTLDGTYARILEEIDDQNWKYAHIFFQCVAAAFRPLRLDELSQFLSFDFEAESTPTFLDDQLPGDPADAVFTMCSSLLAVVKPEGQDSPVVQYAHFSVKEYLTSTRLAEAKDTISRFHVSMTRAHTTIAQGCLGLLLHLDETVTDDGLEKFPFAEYAAENWIAHAQIEDASLKVEDGMKRLFDPSKCHLSVWVWIVDPEDLQRRFYYGFYDEARATSLHYATFCGMHDIVKFLIVEHSQDVNAHGFDLEETPLHVASRREQADIAQLLLDHGADRNAQNNKSHTPLHLSSDCGHVEVVRILLEQGADTEAQDMFGRTPLSDASARGHAEVAQVLLEHGAAVNAKDSFNCTPLYYAEGEEVARVLLKHGADTNTLDIDGRTPLHKLSDVGRLGAARVLLEHGVDPNTRDASNATPLHLASSNSYTGGEGRTNAVRLLLQYGSDIHARDNNGRTPFMIATELRHFDIMEVLLELGAEDHRT
jgi:ankyrin repeat protein